MHKGTREVRNGDEIVMKRQERNARRNHRKILFSFSCLIVLTKIIPSEKRFSQRAVKLECEGICQDPLFHRGPFDNSTQRSEILCFVTEIVA